MKKFVYLSLASLMVAHTASHCMQIIKADEEAGTDNPPTVVLETDNALKVNGPELPSKKELTQQFMEAALVVSTMGRHGVASSKEFKKMQEVYRTHTTVNKGDKKKTKAELYGAADYFSGDEEYYEKYTEDENKTYQKISGIDVFHLPGNQVRATHYKSKATRLEQEIEKVNATLKELFVQKKILKQELEEAVSSQESLKTVATILTNNKEQEISLLRARQGSLTGEIKAVEERIAHSKEESNALLDAEVTESIIAHDISEQVTIEKGLVEEKKKLQEKLKKIEEIIAKLEPKSNWFGW